MSTHSKTVIMVLGVILGIICGEFSLFASEIAIGVLLLSLIQFVLHIRECSYATNVERVSTGRRSHSFSFLLFTSLLTFGIFIGIIRVQLVQEKIVFTCDSCEVVGKIVSSVEIKNEYQIFNIELTDERTNLYDVKVRTSLYPKYATGDTLTLSGKITLPKVVMPHSKESLSSKNFNYVNYLRTEDVGSEMYYPEIRLRDDSSRSVIMYPGRIKDLLVRGIEKYVSPPASSLAVGVLFGVSLMSQELTQTFRVAGLSHIVVLSGFNIVILISAILFLFGFLPLLPRVLFATFSVLMFVTIVGVTPSVLRATVMALISLLALSLGRTYVARQALVISLLGIVMYEPFSLLHDVSLHLSFLAAAGLIYISPQIEIFLDRWYFFANKKYRKALFATSIAAYISTLPYVIFTFGKVSVYALFSNILVVPFVPLAMLLSFLTMLSSFISETVSVVVGFMDSCLIDLMIMVSRVIESLPFSTISVSLTFVGTLLCYVLVFCLVKYTEVSQSNETPRRDESGNLTDIISY